MKIPFLEENKDQMREPAMTFRSKVQNPTEKIMYDYDDYEENKHNFNSNRRIACQSSGDEEEFINDEFQVDNDI